MLICFHFRTNLAPVILQLKSMGIDNVLRFEFLAVSKVHSTVILMGKDALIPKSFWPETSFIFYISIFQRPPAEHMIRALELLYALEGQKMCFDSKAHNIGILQTHCTNNIIHKVVLQIFPAAIDMQAPKVHLYKIYTIKICRPCKCLCPVMCNGSVA